ncbi:MAG: M20/M25/M40 family metallo-hydrolase [Anaerolineae bacterium]|nr:M20/M25/M40 family metallo-hydrolase [Anaerolineae bacterium]
MLRKPFMFLLALTLVVMPAAALAEDGLPDFVTLIATEDVMSHVRALSVAIGARPMGSEAEMKAAEYIAAAFIDWGYEVEIQAFETTPPAHGEEAKEPVTSHNVIATKAGDEGIVVVGAHMDSVTAATGAGDNATGVATVLAAAEALAGVATTHTLVFITFGAEEGGSPSGASYYVESLGEGVEDVIAMINIDSVGVGDALNAYAGALVTWPGEDAPEDAAPEIEGGPVWVRDLALDLAAEMGLPFGTTPDTTWGGFTGDWSDHYAFVEADVPIVYFEAWLWEGEGIENPWWGAETEDGDVMHTEGDIYTNVKPAQVEMTAELVAATAAAIATGMAPVE